MGSTLLLVLGIGTRFFSFLSGLPSVFETSDLARIYRWSFHALGLSVAGLLFLAGRGVTPAYLGLSVVALIYLFFIWKVQRRSSRPSALKIAVRIVAAMIPLSFFLSWLFPAYYLTWFHLVFIGCFAMMTLSVATRVTLAHGAYPLELEIKSQALWYFVSLMSLALVYRILYGLTNEPMIKKSLLHLAATFWILALLAWAHSFLVRILVSGKESKPAC
jgi:hypothetical protein